MTCLALIASVPAQNRSVSNFRVEKKDASRVLAKARETVRLKSEAVQVQLEPGSADKLWLQNQISRVQGSSRLYLVLKDLSAEKTPGVIYQIYLNLPEDRKKDRDVDRQIGAINFYTSKPREDFFFSFDVTDLVKRLASRNLLGDHLTVTIIPAGEPLSGSEPSIGQIQLVLQ